MNSIGRYQIVQKLGQGGMGAVYQAFDPQIQRTVAIKIISTHMVDRPDLRERFFREARAAGQLSHRNIITIYDMGEHEGQPYITMEFVEGRDLDWHMRHGEPMSLARKLDIISEICDGLAYAHERGIIHRDVKPANIMVAPGGQVKILDFGLARVVSSDLTRSNMMFGTMEYMAPEQIRAEAVDHRADIFSVGALFYELITGRRAFQADTFAATMYRILQEVPEPIHELTTDVPPHVAAIVDRALAKSRTERYQSMPEMLRAVRLARQALETGEWTEAVTAYGSSPSPLTPPLTPPDAPTMEISRPPSPPPGTPPPGTPLPSGSAATQPSPTAPASGPAQLMGGLSRAGLGVKAAGAAVLVLLIAGGVYLATRSSGPEPPAGDVAGTGGPESVPAPPAPAPAPAPPAPVPSPGAGAGNQEQPAEPAPSNPATPAPAEEETPRETPKPPPDASERRADAAARARAESALRQMAQARNNAETSQAPDLVPDAYRRAVAQEREARNALAKGDYLQAVASAHEARASYVLADSEARRIGAAREEEARRAKARQAALDQLQTLRRAWALNRQSAERAGASTTGGSELAQAIGRVERAEQTAEQDPEGAVRVYQEAIATAQHARDEAAAAARKAAEAAKVKPPAPTPAPAPTPPAPAPGPSSAEAARRGIEDLLQRYVSALQGRDIDALKQIWPSLGGDAERAIREQFANARAISVTLGSPQITVSNGTAVVVCRRDYEVETRDGQRPRTSTRTTLQLRRNENRWLIENIRYEPLE